MIIETFRQALQNVWSNKLRTFLTMLGIIIGVMAVIVIVGLGNGMTQSMRDSFSALGTNALSIQVWGYGSRTASVEDVYKIADKNKELISAVSPQIDFSNNTPKVGTTTYRYGTSVYGVDEHYAEMKNYTLAQGRGLQYMDIKDNKQVCIIGDYLNRAAYGGNAVGQTIKLGAYKFLIVGVLNAKVTDKNLQQGSDDDCIYLPYTTAMRLSNQSSAKKRVAFGAPYPGKILPMDLRQLGGMLICQKDSFLCAARGVSLGIHFQQKLSVGFFGGEGFIMQKLEGDGLAFVHAGGTVLRRELRHGETLRIDTGCVVAYTPNVDFEIQYVGKIKTALFGGEGLFFAKMTGPGTVWLKSLPFSRLASRVFAAAPQTGGSSSDEGSLLGGFLGGNR